ncbi:DNA repair protein [uncultured Jannaschia sp.]|uniref:DNA repair protein n=1 Tax=uncultured Jannaschia sp. TaxID=293347 RepID=UPI00260268DE|nr:DNA repair protein [uncultured Jannaschia sp.]
MIPPRSLDLATSLLQQVTTALLVATALGLSVLTAGAAAGLLPWPELALSVGGTPVPRAGMFVQIALTGFVLVLLGYLPSVGRVRRLELTNRDFRMSMDDVTRAYALVHAADREGAFGLSREFDAMRDRIEWMRAHPDLAELEPDVLQVAAQMSVESRDLAQVYGREKVERAREFLRQRQHEVEEYRQRIVLAQVNVAEIKRWTHAVDIEEALAEQQLDRLRRDLGEITDSLGLTGPDRKRKVIGLPRNRRDPGRDTAATPAE